MGLAAAALCAAQEPTRVFMSHCMNYHSANSGAHAPMPEAMAGIPWQDILKILESGSMKVQGATLTAEERVAVARYLGSSGPAAIPEMSGFCGPPTAVPGLVFSGSMDGHVRAYRIADGEMVLDFDAARDFPTVNGIKAHGGSFSATGPTVAGCMLFVNSGYANTGGMAGNILLAFSVK
jgi:hypothetical protein